MRRRKFRNVCSDVERKSLYFVILISAFRRQIYCNGNANSCRAGRTCRVSACVWTSPVKVPRSALRSTFCAVQSLTWVVRSPMGFPECIFNRFSLSDFISNRLLTRSQDLVFPSVCTVFHTGTERWSVTSCILWSMNVIPTIFIIGFVCLLFCGSSNVSCILFF